jgi:hypothetical protein
VLEYINKANVKAWKTRGETRRGGGIQMYIYTIDCKSVSFTTGNISDRHIRLSKLYFCRNGLHTGEGEEKQNKLMNSMVRDSTQHDTAQHNTTLHYTTLHYTTLHYTTLHYTTLHYTTLHYTTLHYTILHYTA